MKNRSLQVPGLSNVALSNCGSAVPEYAILTCLLAAVLMISIGPMGFQVKETFHSFGLESSPDREFATTQNKSLLDETMIRSQAGSELPTSEGMFTLGTALVAVSFVWLLSRHRSKRKFKKPRPLVVESEQTENETVFDKRQQILQVISNNREALLSGHLEVWHLADRDPKTISPDHSVDSALEIMNKYQLEHLLVCEDDRSLVGIVSKYFLLKTDFVQVVDAMATQPLFVAPDAMLNPTVTHMLNQGVTCVAVVQDEKTVGVLTATDFQLTLQVALQILAGTASVA